ncbi:glycosyltransferase [Rhodohalobacter sp. SW132]|uniref:glycosyltransferase family 2 protein n=1 Tax=Rhodohalobacter sp. SW132 TaxID=2293433 RepID=UPI000E256290|nr:glycosyltransferase family 2 protein [Rhodohalobacter sp. SW132]REL24196.1 glycosyltransferase [Rhodohalobacter sp. SW132]
MNSTTASSSGEVINTKSWPWNKEIGEKANLAPAKSHKNNEWPKITIVTPSYNQGEFIEETIRSIILQNYPNLEYFIIDGGSTDNTVEVIKKYEDWIDYWVSEPDNGQSDAVNKGFERATGTYGNWINSDDLLAEDALLNIAKHIEGDDQKTLYLGKCIHTDKHLNIQAVQTSNIRTIDDLLDIEHHWGKNAIAQQNVLFNVEQFREVGGLKVNNHYAMDYELWGDLLINGNSIRYLDFEVGIFRRYEGQKISDRRKTVNCLLKSAHKLVIRNKDWSIPKKIRLTFNLFRYRLLFIKKMISMRSRIKKKLAARASKESVKQ